LDTISLCTIFRDEAAFLLEWLGYHKAVGVDQFVLYDNNSNDGGRALIESSPFASDVTVVDCSEEPGQLAAYHHFCLHYAQRTTWAAFVDLDEFIHPLESDTLPALLPRYEPFSAVLLNWNLFGPSGHDTRPLGLVIENYLKRVSYDAEINRHVKSLVRTADLIDIGPTPHVLRVLGPSCNARGEEVEAVPVQAQVCADVLVVNHYFTKSREDWSLKTQRGRADTNRAEDQYFLRQAAMFDSTSSLARYHDARIMRFATKVRASMG
jgi:hypothetical protein